MELRPTTVDDFPALHALFLEAVRGVFEPHGFESPALRFEVFANQQQHVLETGTSLVADDQERPAAFGAAWQRGDHWFLASLFVDPAHQGQGLGTALLDGLWGDATHRTTIT